MAEHPVPSAEDQLAFLRNTQRILKEGNFVSTYKFALLHALAGLSVLKGDDSGAPLVISTEDLAHQFVKLYERQALPFPGQDEVLKQNTGRQAAIVRNISEAAMAYAGQKIKLHQETGLINKTRNTIKEMPLWKLQRVGSEVMDFLYDNTFRYATAIESITLKPGVAFCFRTFYEFITSMVQNAWIEYVRKYNTDILGEQADLRAFLFGARRSDLSDLRALLRVIQDGRCFYTRRRLNDASEVDHFIPWSRFATDLGHNFVLASAQVNAHKRDHIADEKHLARWIQFNLDHDIELVRGYEGMDLQYSLKSSLLIARWCYENTDRAQAQVWERGQTLHRLSGEWRTLIDQGLQAVSADDN